MRAEIHIHSEQQQKAQLGIRNLFSVPFIHTNQNPSVISDFFLFCREIDFI